MTAHIADSTAEQTNGLSPPSTPDDRFDLIETLAAAMRQLGRRRIWMATAVVFLPFAWAFFASSAPFAIPKVEAACGQQPPDMHFFTSADELTGFLDGCGPGGRAMYRNMQVADLIYPAVVGLFMASSLALVLSRLAIRRRNLVWLASIPIVGSLFDYIENLFAWFALARYPASAPTDALLGYASAAKTVTSWVGGVLLLGALVILGAQLIRRRVRPEVDHPDVPRPIGRRTLSA